MKVEAIMVRDWIEPYRSLGQMIPIVLRSDHPRFPRGTRLDYGFIKIILEEGCSLEVIAP